MRSMNRRTALRLGGITLGTALAGCLDDGEDGEDGADTEDGENDTEDGENGTEDGTETEDENGGAETETETETEDTGPETLIITLENENGDPVWSGVTVTVELPGSPAMTHNAAEPDLAPNEGQLRIENQDRPGEYAITVEGEDGETVEEEVTVPEGETEEVTIVLEGHPGDTPEEDGE